MCVTDHSGDVKAMNRTDALTLTRREVGVSKHIPFTHLNSPTVAETRDGLVFSVLKLDGVPFQTEKNETINQQNGLWQRVLASLDEQVGLTVTVHRKPINPHLEGSFSHPTLQRINDRYQERFQDRMMFRNDIYMTVLYRGMHSGKIGKSLSFLNRMSDSVMKEARQERRQYYMRELSKIIDRLLGVLSSFHPHVLGSQDAALEESELLGFLSMLVNGGDGQHLPKKGVMAPIAKSVGDIKKEVKQYPEGNLAHYLPLKRIFFGEAIQFQGLTQRDNRFAGILSIKSYPEESASVALNTLMHLECEWISTHSFAVEAKDITMKKVKQHSNKLRNVNDAGISQIEALNGFQELVQTGAVNAGYHHHTLMVLSDQQKTLDTFIHQAARCYLEVGFPVVRETIGQEPAFWAQLPGNLNYIARSCLITSQNFSDFCPLHNYPVGYRDGNHLGDAVTLLETTSKTPYFFNFHKAGSKTEITPGHSTIIGSNGAGKTVLMTFFDAQLSRYQGRSVFFDRDRGAEIYVRATGGVYSILSPDYPEETCFNPLQLPDTATNRKFCQDWLGQLCKREGEVTLEAEILAPLELCINYAFEKLLPEHRQLSHAVKVLPVDFQRWPQLRRWLRGNGKHDAGEYAYLFDNEKDALHARDKMGFDMTHFLDNEPPQIRTAVLMYLFHWIKSLLDGRLMAVWLDEAWQYFVDPFWEKELKKILPTFRKLNACLILATQSAASVAESSLRNVILDNSATQIFFPNPQGRAEYYRDGFHLTESEFLFIKENEAKSRQFLIKHGQDSVICRLDLSHMREEISILSADKKTIRLLDRCREEVGNDPENWLPLFMKERSLL